MDFTKALTRMGGGCGTGIGSCPVVVFGISSVEPSTSTTREVVN
jgi:hypothetical protein